MSALVNAYLAGDPAVLEFYASPPRAVFDRAPRPGSWAEGLPEALRVYNERLGLTPRFHGDEAVIVTGQQPGLFTGPLYTVYKAITAVQLARELETRHGTPVVPVFWLGADDHDFEEARAVWALSRDHEPREYRYEPARDVAGMPMYRVPAGPELHALVDDLAGAVPGSEFTGEITGFLHASLDEADSFADWTARLLARLFLDTPLVLFAPHLQAAREAARPVMAGALADPGLPSRLVNAEGARLEAMGHAAQVVKADSECAFFLEMGGRRRKVLFEAGEFYLPEEDQRLSPKALREMLESAPERFSPNVALRCIVQQALFPVAAYVAGPGEIAYWAQLKPLFEHFGRRMPIVYPRARAVISNIKVNKLCAKLGLMRDDLDADPETLVTRALRLAARSPALDALERGSGPLLDAARALMDALEAAGARAGDRPRRLVSGLERELHALERAIVRQDEAKVEGVRNQVRRVCATLAPFRKPQERVYTVFSFVFQQGWGLTPRLSGAIDPEHFGMHEVEL
jgi:bacillithiol biosynthesis cysteine-adding enzyme BshC